MRIRKFIFYKNRIDKNYWQTNSLRIFFWYFIILKICVDFFIILSFKLFHCIQVHYRIHIWCYFWHFQKILLYFFQQFIIFYQKIYIFSSIKVSSMRTSFWKEYAYKSNCFSFLIVNKIFKIHFTKANLVRCYYFVNIYIVYQNRAFKLVKFAYFNFSIIKICIFSYIFICGSIFSCFSLI